jgi:hypothetical protein
MNRPALRMLLGILCTVVALLMVPTLFYNACGLAGMGDCAEGPKWILTLNVFACSVIFLGGLFVSYRLFRRKNEGRRP